MSGDHVHNAETASQYFEKVNDELKEQFINYGEVGSEIKLLFPEQVSGFRGKGVEDLATAATAEVVQYSKVSLLTTRLASGSVAEVNVVNKNKNYDTLVWTTSPNNIKKALRSGVFDPHPIQNPLAKMIAQLGTYKKLVFTRSLEENFVVKHNVKKLAVVDFTQDCIELLQPLHICLNNHDSSLSPKQNMENLIARLEAYSQELKKIKESNKSTDEFYKDLYAGIDGMLVEVYQYTSALQMRLKDLGVALKPDNMQAILRTYANPVSIPDLSLQHFIQQQLNILMSNAVEANYSTSGLFQDSSGLQGIITETQYISEGFSSDDVDYHNPFTLQHAFEFGDGVKDSLVTMDMRRFGFVPNSRLDLAKQLALIERIDSDKILYNDKDEVRGFFGINWRGNIRAPLTWLSNALKDIVGTTSDIIYLGSKAVLDIRFRMQGKKPEPVDFPSGAPDLLKTNLTEKYYAAVPVNQQLYQVDPPTKLPHVSLIQQFYAGAATIVSRYLIEPVVSVTSVVVDELWYLRSLHKIRYDASIGLKKINDAYVEDLLKRHINEKHANEAGNEISKQALIESYEELNKHSDGFSYQELLERLNERKLISPNAAVIPYHLTPDKPGDFINFITNDLGRDLVQFFSHEIYRGHPAAGLAFTLAASTAAPMIIPAFMKNATLAAIHQNISLPLAQTLIGETSGVVAGISTAILQGKITYLVIDSFNGSNSWLNFGIKSLLENPVTASVVTAAAISFGYLIAYDLNIPYLSEKIAHETSQASFPYFELGLTGAKFAAILVEGTLNLHYEKHHISSDEFVDNTIDKMLPEIKTSMTQGYCIEHNCKKEALTPTDRNSIDISVAMYCSRIKDALKKPEIAEQISQLAYTLGTQLGIKEPPKFNGVAPMIGDIASQRELAQLLQSREKRHMIAELNPENLTEKDKYIILNYLSQNYPNDPDYVASVRARFEQEKKFGPSGETFKIIMTYPGTILRSSFALFRTVGYQTLALYYELTKNTQRAADMRQTGSYAIVPVNDFGRKIKNDLGLLVKGVTAIFRNLWGLAAGSLLTPMTLLVAAPVGIFSSKYSIKIFSRINRTLFEPGALSQLLDYFVGVLRVDAGSKNMTLITQDVDIRYNRKILNPPQGVVQNTTVIKEFSSPLKKVKNDDFVRDQLVTEFLKYDSIRHLKSHSLEQLVEMVKSESAKGDKYKFYIFNTPKTQFNHDLREALLEVHSKIAQMQSLTFKEQLAYQEMIMDLFHGNVNDPIITFKISYEAFSKVDLPTKQPHDPEILAVYKAVNAAQNAVQLLKVVYDKDKEEKMSRSAEVAQLIRDHDCLSLHAVRQIDRLQKIIQKKTSEHPVRVRTKEDLATARTLLYALGSAHHSARIASHKLASNKLIFKALTELHKLPAVDQLSIGQRNLTFNNGNHSMAINNEDPPKPKSPGNRQV